jgi:hypothetical protein
MADLIKIRGSIAKIQFDQERTLIPKHKYIRNAVLASGKNLLELLDDPWGGLPFVIQALIEPGLPQGEDFTIDQASELIDKYLENARLENVKAPMRQLQKALLTILMDYCSIEFQAKKEPVALEEEAGGAPNVPSPVARAKR